MEKTPQEICEATNAECERLLKDKREYNGQSYSKSDLVDVAGVYGLYKSKQHFHFVPLKDHALVNSVFFDRTWVGESDNNLFIYRLLGLESRALEAEIKEWATMYAICEKEWLEALSKVVAKHKEIERLKNALTSIAIHAGACAQSNGTEQDFRAIYEIATEARDSAPK